MTITINPYANVLNFPAGTPASVINAVLAMRMKADAQAQQPKWWETGINNILGGVTNQLVMPWLQNEFVNLPYQTDLNTMKTDQNIRQYLAEQSGLTGELNQRDLNKQSLLNQNTTDFGNAINAMANAYQPQTTTTDTGVTEPYGPFEDPWATSPGPQFEPPTQMQGETAPTGRDRIITSSTYNPTTADAFRTVAGQSPFNAGLMANAYEKNANLSNLLDPTKQRLLQAQEKNLLSQASNRESQVSDRQATQAARIDELVSKNVLTKIQGDLLKSRMGLVGAQTELTQGKSDEQQFRLGILENLPQDEQKKLLFKGVEKFPTNLQARFNVIMSENPGMDENAAMKEAIRQNDAVSPLNQLMVRKEAIPMDMARSELPKVQQALRDAQMFDTNLEVVNKGMQKIQAAGISPASSTYADLGRAWLDRQVLNTDVMRDPDVQAALGAFSQLRNAVAVGYDRSIGDKGARIGAAYNLPTDPTYIPAGEWNGMYQAMKKGAQSDVQYLNSMLDSMNQTIYGKNTPTTPINQITPGRGAGGINFNKPTPNAKPLGGLPQ